MTNSTRRKAENRDPLILPIIHVDEVHFNVSRCQPGPGQFYMVAKQDHGAIKLICSIRIQLYF